MEPIKNLFGQIIAPPKKTRRTERGDLIDGFYLDAIREWDEVSYRKLTPGRIRLMLAGIPTKDLYALKSKCEDARHRGNSWVRTFRWEITPQ
jgi:hypothetical protein